MVERPSLDDFANKHQTDKGTLYPDRTKHGYAPIYEKYLHQWRDESIRMLEIGVCMEKTDGGQSVKMWLDYFTSASIYAFDIVDMSILESYDQRIKFYKGDQGIREDFEKMYEAFGKKPFDFILEDGSHLHHHQIISLGCLFKYIRPGGYYILEDMTERGIQTCCTENDETLETLNRFIETGLMENENLREDEKIYLNKNISKIEIYPDILDKYRVAIIHKK